jgi:hypothetical protein
MVIYKIIIILLKHEYMFAFIDLRQS